jgi:hypothetical protein
MTQINQTIVDANLIDDEIPAWKRLENAISLWVRTTKQEQQLEAYIKLHEYYE